MMPARLQARLRFPSLSFAEHVADQRADRIHRLLLVGTVDLERDARALAGRIITPMMLFALTLRPLRDMWTSL